MMELAVRTIAECDGGFVIYSAMEVDEIFRSAGIANSSINIGLINPDNNETVAINVDDTYTLLSLYRDICKELGVKAVFAIDSERPALFEMMIEYSDNYLITIEDYTIPLKDVLKAFGTNLKTLYLSIIFGKGEVFRGDGLKMSMRAEPNARHHGAHVHVDGKDGRNASIAIETTKEYESSLNNKELKRAKDIVKENSTVLLDIWKALTIEGVSIDVDYKLGRIGFSRK